MFLEWLEAIEHEHNDLLSDSGFRTLGHQLSESYGRQDTSVVLKRYSKYTGRSMDLTRRGAPAIFSASHRQESLWPVVQKYQVSISARAARKGFRSFNFANGSRAIPKHYSLRFEANTNAPRPFEVHWQVVNTGDEARSENGLRGGFYSGEGYNGLLRKESTRYTGRH